jgi:succinoglycan biosynthesis protein ExoA
MTYPDGFVSQLVDDANQTGATSVVVSMQSAADVGGGCFQHAAAVAQNSVLGTGGSAHRRACKGQWVDHGHHALFKTRDFIAAGGYDEAFTHNEDAEFDVRFRQRGGQIWLSHAARPIYHPRASATALWRQYFNYGRGRAHTAAKHAAKLKLRQTIPLLVLPAALLAAASPLFWPLAIPAVIWAGLCLGYGAYLGVCARDFGGALSGGSAMIMHLAWSAGFWAERLEISLIRLLRPAALTLNRLARPSGDAQRGVS